MPGPRTRNVRERLDKAKDARTNAMISRGLSRAAASGDAEAVGLKKTWVAKRARDRTLVAARKARESTAAGRKVVDRSAAARKAAATRKRNGG